MIGGSGETDMKGGFGDDTFVGGAGADTMVGGHGHNVFEFLNKDAAARTSSRTSYPVRTSCTWKASRWSFLEKAGDVSVSGGNTFITLDGGHTHIELQGTTSLKPWDVTTHKP